MDVFLDLEQQDNSEVQDGEMANRFFDKFQTNLEKIGARIKQIKKVGISYASPSVLLFDQAKDLYCLGYFASAIIVCRSIAEYLAYEIFYEEVEIDGKDDLIELVADNLDFRKIVNEFLYNPKKGYSLIDETSSKLFNKLYDVGNQWIHPRKTRKIVNIESVAKESLDTLQTLLSSLRDVLNEYDISEGVLVKKPSARKKVRPIKIESPVDIF